MVGEELVTVARAALAAYDIPTDARVEPIRLKNNAVFDVQAQGTRLVVRLHRPEYRSANETRSELRFLQALSPRLKGTRIRVPEPIATRDGDLVVEVGGRHASVLTWVDGRELKPTRGLGPRSTFLLGEALARNHCVADEFDPSGHFELPRWDAETMFASSSPFQPGPMEDFLAADDWRLFREVAERTRATFAKLDAMPNAWGIIHNDFILINCRFARRAGGWMLGVLDFDDLGWGYYLYDLAPLLDNLADFPASYAALSRAFLAGYRSIRPLPRSLETHLPTLMAARHAVTLTWLAAKRRRGETDLPIERHVGYRMELMRRCLTM